MQLANVIPPLIVHRLGITHSSQHILMRIAASQVEPQMTGTKMRSVVSSYDEDSESLHAWNEDKDRAFGLMVVYISARMITW